MIRIILSLCTSPNSALLPQVTIMPSSRGFLKGGRFLLRLGGPSDLDWSVCPVVARSVAHSNGTQGATFMASPREVGLHLLHVQREADLACLPGIDAIPPMVSFSTFHSQH